MNTHKAVEKKPEHGGGWVFMSLNKRGVYIHCKCNRGEENDHGFSGPGHATAEEAERCFWEKETAEGIRWATQSSANRCAICEEWTPDMLHGAGHYIDPHESVCRKHFADESHNPDDEAAAKWLWERHPFTPGITIYASW